MTPAAARHKKIHHKDTKSTKKNTKRSRGAKDGPRPCAMERVNQLSNEVIGAAIEVHRCLGPGLSGIGL